MAAVGVGPSRTFIHVCIYCYPHCRSVVKHRGGPGKVIICSCSPVHLRQCGTEETLCSVITIVTMCLVGIHFALTQKTASTAVHVTLCALKQACPLSVCCQAASPRNWLSVQLLPTTLKVVSSTMLNVLDEVQSASCRCCSSSTTGSWHQNQPLRRQ